MRWTRNAPPVMGESQVLPWGVVIQQRDEALDLLKDAEYGGAGVVGGRASWEAQRKNLLDHLRVKDKTVRERVDCIIEGNVKGEVDGVIVARILADAIDELKEKLK